MRPGPRLGHAVSRVAYRTAHRWEPCEVGGIVEKLRSENVRGDEVVGEAGDYLARVSRVSRRVSIAALALFLSRASFLTGHRVGRVCVSCARRCASLLFTSRLPRRRAREEVMTRITRIRAKKPVCVAELEAVTRQARAHFHEHAGNPERAHGRCDEHEHRFCGNHPRRRGGTSQEAASFRLRLHAPFRGTMSYLLVHRCPQSGPTVPCADAPSLSQNPKPDAT